MAEWGATEGRGVRRRRAGIAVAVLVVATCVVPACGGSGHSVGAAAAGGTSSGGGLASGGSPGSTGGAPAGGVGNGGAASGSGGTGAGGASAGAPTDGGTAAGGASGSGGTAGTGGTNGAGGGSTGATALYVLFDKTLSMTTATNANVSRYEAARAGFLAFLDSAAAQGLDVGMMLWANGSLGTCDASGYTGPDVAIGPLAGSRTAIADTLSQHSPDSFTVAQPAIEAAAGDAKKWLAAHPGRDVALVLMADGLGNALFCTSDDPVSAALATAKGSPPIRTFMLGLEDSLTAVPDGSQSGYELFEQVAQAGGTGHAVVADVGRVGENAVRDAFTTIAGRL